MLWYWWCASGIFLHHSRSTLIAELLHDFLNKDFPGIPHIIGNGILPVKGKCIIGGNPKSNKSFLALNIGLDIAMGSTILNHFPVPKKRRVLYIEQEIGEEGLQERLIPLVLVKKAQNPELAFFIKTRDMLMRMDTDNGRNAIVEEIKQVNPEVVIFDPLAKFHLSDENSAQAMGAIMRVGDHLVEDFGCALIYIHHTSKDDYEHPRRGGQRLRGSSAIFADADSFIEVNRLSSATAKEPILQLTFELRRGKPIDYPVFVKRLESGLIVLQERPERPEAKPKKGPYANL